MARGRSSGYEDQRELILLHAAELFAQRGYSATSMNGVAEACGLSKPALYHYFKDKNALLLEICEAHITRLIALVDEVDQLALAAEPRLRALVERYRCAVVLKGAGSLVAAPGQTVRVIGAGNPGMAVGGMGDLLTGIIAYFAGNLAV